MKVVAVRDDGALLITSNGYAAVILSDEGAWATTVHSARARGVWNDPAGETVPEESRAFVEELLKQAEDELGEPPAFVFEDSLIAAAEVHTGAMIALIPSAEDAARLVVDGGEPQDQLHTTLVYLGEAKDYSSEEREKIVELAHDLFTDVPVIRAEGFAVAMFNPPDMPRPMDGKDRDACVVLVVSGNELDIARTAATNITLSQFSEKMTNQHLPWIPHITLLYTDDADLSYFTDLTGPVTYDTVRIAFGDEVYDIPLGEDVEEGATVASALAMKFNPNQPRDPRTGRWIKVGSSLPKLLDIKDIIKKSNNGELKDGEIVGYIYGSDQTRLVARKKGQLEVEYWNNGKWSSMGVDPADSYTWVTKITDKPEQQTISTEPEIDEPTAPQVGRAALKAAPEPDMDAQEGTSVYMSDDYRFINEAYRGIAPEPNMRITNAMKVLDEAFERHKLKDDIEVYRGVFMGSRTFGREAWNRPDLIGLEWVDQAPSSTTAREDIANQFTSEFTGESVRMKIRVPRGTPAMRLSGWDGEAEILLKPGLRYRVVEDNGVQNGVRQLTVEVVG